MAECEVKIRLKRLNLFDFQSLCSTYSQLLVTTAIFVLLGAGMGYGVPADITISPSGPIFADVGTTVVVNCSRGQNIIKPNIRWRHPWDPDKAAPRTKDGTSKGRLSNSWVDRHILQLVISNIQERDAGYYTCEVGDSNRNTAFDKSVRISVLNPNGNSSTCNFSQYRCPNTDICINIRYRCDRIPDCPFDLDELNCPKVSCDGKFICSNGQCIDKKQRCDRLGIPHCRDASDEVNCPGRLTEYSGRIRERNSTAMPSINSQAHEGQHNSWHFNAIYSGVAAVVGLVCVIAVVVVTVCRIHMRRASFRQMMVNRNSEPETRRSHHRNSHRSTRHGWQQTTPPAYDPPDMEDCVFPHRCPATNVAVNINVQFTPNANPEFTSLLVTPPPYTEVGEPTEDEAPPPYSTIDRGKIHSVGPPRQRGTPDGAVANTSASSSGTSSNGSHNTNSNREEISMDFITSPADVETGQRDRAGNIRTREDSSSANTTEDGAHAERDELLPGESNFQTTV